MICAARPMSRSWNSLLRGLAFKQFLFLSALVPCHAAMAHGVSPYGVFKVHSQQTGHDYHLVVTEDASILGIPGAFLTQIQKICADASAVRVQNVAIPYLAPEWQRETGGFLALGYTTVDANALGFGFRADGTIEGGFRSTAPILLANGSYVNSTTFTGARLSEEIELTRLARDSVIASATDWREANGCYRGVSPDGKHRLSVTLVGLNDIAPGYVRTERWLAQLKFGDWPVPMRASGVANGLVRFVGKPVGLNPLAVRGVSGTVVRGERGGLEFRGLFFEVQNGCTAAIRLKKVANGDLGCPDERALGLERTRPFNYASGRR